jgi:drug/metabolite transporter (DMT)-like permease
VAAGGGDRRDDRGGGDTVSRRGWVLFAAMCVVWGVPYLMIKVAVTGVSVPVVVATRTALGVAVLLPLALRSGGFRSLRPCWAPLLAFTLLEMVIPWGLLSDAERHVPSSLAGLLIAAVPILGVVIARLTGGTERLSPVRWAGLVIGLAGVAVLAAPDLAGGSTWAVTEVLLVAVCYASGPLVVARKLTDVPTLPVTAVSLSLATVVYAPAAALHWPRHVPSAEVLAALAGLGLICTALAFILFLQLLKEAGPSRAMVFTYINPAVAVAAGVLLLGESFTATVAAAFVLILGGSVLATLRQRAPGEPQAAGPAAPQAGAATAASTSGRPVPQEKAGLG